jgi:hypothetical protein
MVALTLILEIVAVALGVILVTGGVVLDNQVKKMLDEGVCDALRIDDQFGECRCVYACVCVHVCV